MQSVQEMFLQEQAFPQPHTTSSEWAGDTGEEDSQRKGNILGLGFSSLSSSTDQEQGARDVMLASFLYRL